MSKYNAMVGRIAELGSVLVAFSGGVDSSLLLAASIDALSPERVLAVTAGSVIHPPGEPAMARDLAGRLGSPWLEVGSREMLDPDFLANTPERCYHCKKGLLESLKILAAQRGLAFILEGSNLSDMGDFRPGFRAVKEAGVLSPLLEAGLSKEEIREAARRRGIPGWDRPSDACLCSRVPFGVKITPEILKKIHLAEEALKKRGFKVARVRHHGDTARLEVDPGEMEKLFLAENRESILKDLSALGYRYVTVDLAGYRTGSMNPGSP